MFEKNEIKQKEAGGGPFFKKRIDWVMIVAQLVEQSLLTSEIRGSNPVIGEL